VDAKTVARWGKRYGFTIVRTPGGHRRFRAEEVRNFIRGRNPDGTPREA
jgi:predicted RNA binding protein YcfA (HicA-like mRNA interferase family)